MPSISRLVALVPAPGLMLLAGCISINTGPIAAVNASGNRVAGAVAVDGRASMTGSTTTVNGAAGAGAVEERPVRGVSPTPMPTATATPSVAPSATAPAPSAPPPTSTPAPSEVHTAGGLGRPGTIGGIAFVARDSVFYTHGDGLHRLTGLAPSRFETPVPAAPVAGDGGVAGAGFAGDGGPASAALMSGPLGLVAAPDGSLWVADTGNHRIRRIRPDGTIETVAGGEAGWLDGPALDARFTEPTALALAADGGVFIADAGNGVIRRIRPDGLVVTIAGSGPGYADGPGAAAKFERIRALAVSASGRKLAVASGSRIRLVDLGSQDHVVTTLAGGVAGFADGPGADARFGEPAGLAFDGADNLLVSDSGNHRIRKIDPAGTVRTIAGDGVAATVDGPAARARFSRPGALTMVDGVVLVADQGSGKVRLLRLAASAPAAGPENKAK